MKKLIPLFLVLLLAFSCKDECSDEFCPDGYTCVNGVCESSASAQFAGSYDTDYEGTGGLDGSDGNTTARVSEVANNPNKIRIEVELDLMADVLGSPIDLPLDVSIEGDVSGDNYSIPSTSIVISIDLGGFPIPVDLTFDITGTKVSENQLNSTLRMSGFINGSIQMEGTK